MPCLECGYDLRSGVTEGAGSILCPECGQANDLRQLHLQGLSGAFVAALATLVIAPPGLLLLTSWLFALWSGESLHACLSLFVAPAVIGGHTYAVWTLTQSSLIVRRRVKRRWRWTATVTTIVIDLAAVITVLLWFVI